jgi:hypothetical protein
MHPGRVRCTLAVLAHIGRVGCGLVDTTKRDLGAEDYTKHTQLNLNVQLNEERSFRLPRVCEAYADHPNFCSRDRDCSFKAQAPNESGESSFG